MAAADMKRILGHVLPWPELKKQASLVKVENHLELIEGSLWEINSMYMRGLMMSITEPYVKQWTDEVEEAVSDVDELLRRILHCRQKDAPEISPPVRGGLPLGQKEMAGKQWTDKVEEVVSDVVEKVLRRIPQRQPKEAPAAISPSVRGDILRGLTETAAKLNLLSSRGSALGLQEKTMDSMDAHDDDFSAVLKKEVVGLDNATDEIIKKLRSEQQYEETPKIFCIVGDEGMGKTTLARMVFHHEWVRNYFQHHIWLDSPNSFSFDPISIARAFVENVTKEPCGHKNYLQQLWLDISKKLGVGRYFFVLDDVPVLKKDRDKWEQLRHVFLHVGSPGSRVVAVTSMFDSDLSESDSTFTKLHTVEGLLRDSWTTLLQRHASALAGDHQGKEIRESSFGLSDEDAGWLHEKSRGNPLLARDYQDKEIRKSSFGLLDEVAAWLHEKSRGNPLLAKVWGSTLQCTKLSRWQKQIEALMQKPVQDEKHFRLWSSQYLIPKYAHLYLFCSLFQQDHQNDFEDLFHVMAAQDFVQDSSNKELIKSNLERLLCPQQSEGTLTNDLIRSLLLEEKQPPENEEVRTYWITERFPNSTLQLQCRHLSLSVPILARDLTTEVTLPSPSKLRTLKLTIRDAENEEQKMKKITEDQTSQTKKEGKKKEEKTMEDQTSPIKNEEQKKMMKDQTSPIKNEEQKKMMKDQTSLIKNEEQKKKKKKKKEEEEEEGSIEKVLRENFPKLRYLRVLDLRATKIAIMPDTVDKLVNLRYLNLSGSNIDKFPDSFGDLRSLQVLKLAHCYKLGLLPQWIGKLQNLQVLTLPFCKNLTKLPKSAANLTDLQELDLECCRRLEEFPDEFGKLKRLRSLSLAGCLRLKKMPSGLRQLTELRKLSGFVAFQESGSCTVTELEPLKFLEDLQLRCLEQVSNKADAQAMKLKNKRFTKNLVLHWKMNNVASSDDSLLGIIECLQPGTALRTLEIISYAGKDFPNWMKVGQPYHYTLTEIKLVNLWNCTSLPPLGQLARLEVVEISGMPEIRNVGDEVDDDAFYGANGTFASLRKLTFSEMPVLETWVKVKGKPPPFPKLDELMIIQCPKLKRLQVMLPAVKKLSLWLSNGTLLTSKSWDWSMFSDLEELEIVGCPGVEHLPESIESIKKMKHLTLIGLNTLKPLPKLKQDCCCLNISRCGAVPEQKCKHVQKDLK